MASANKEEKDVIILRRGINTTCAVHLHGATITSWRIDNREQLFVGKWSSYDKMRPIRGGISLAFPYYAGWSFGPNYGHARMIRWRPLVLPRLLPSGDVEAAFIVCDSAYTRSIWSNWFWLCLWITLQTNSLQIRFYVFNTNNVLPFECTPMLMASFRMLDVRKCAIAGLEKCDFTDNAAEMEYVMEDKQRLHVDKPIHRLYSDTPDIHIIDPYDGCTITVIKDVPDTAIWNPWTGIGSETCFYSQVKEEKDFDEGEYRKVLRVACGCAKRPVVLDPGEHFIGRVALNIRRPKTSMIPSTERQTWSSRVFPALSRTSLFEPTPHLPHWSDILYPIPRDRESLMEASVPSSSDIPYMVVEEIFADVTRSSHQSN